jgi:hypothetical protein
MPSPKQQSDFREFLDWVRFYGFAMPVPAEAVGDYLLELLADGATLPQIKRSADSIAACYVQRRHFLDPVPIRAALKLAAAQLSPGRTIN